MFGEFLKQWCRLFFWWMPSDQKQEHEERGSEAGKRTNTVTTQSNQAAASKPAPDAAGKASSPEDDLTAIKGIGPTMDKRLRAMGIRTFRDLAAADAQEVARKLNARPVTAERVGEWIAEAKKCS